MNAPLRDHCELDANTVANIAAMVRAIRPDWPAAWLRPIIERHATRDARDVAAALAWIALDPATDLPGRVNHAGPWWFARSAPSRSVRYSTAKRQPDPLTPEQVAQRKTAADAARAKIRAAQLKHNTPPQATGANLRAEQPASGTQHGSDDLRPGERHTAIEGET